MRPTSGVQIGTSVCYTLLFLRQFEIVSYCIVALKTKVCCVMLYFLYLRTLFHSMTLSKAQFKAQQHLIDNPNNLVNILKEILALSLHLT